MISVTSSVWGIKMVTLPVSFLFFNFKIILIFNSFEWIKKIWHVETMEYYSALIKNEITPFATTWMDPEIFMLREVTQRQISYDSTYM